MTPPYLAPELVAEWLICPGRPALEELEAGAVAGVPAPLSEALTTFLEARRTQLATDHPAASIDLERLTHVDIGLITGERFCGSLVPALLIVHFEDHALLEVYADPEASPEYLQLLALASLIKHSLLEHVTDTNHGSAEFLYAFGAKVTEAAALSLSLRGDVAALSHLTVSEHCHTCRAAHRCPALAESVHVEVFGELQEPSDPDLQALHPASRLGEGDDLDLAIRHAYERLPLIEFWCDSIRAQYRLIAGQNVPRGTTAPTKRRKPKKRKKSRPSVSAAP